MKPDLWWLTLKSGDRVFVPRERNKESGMATVYSNGKKYIHVSLQGTPMRIVKATGCTEDYPGFQICKDEKDHMDAVWQRKQFRDALEYLSALSRINGFRPTAADVELITKTYNTIVGKDE